MREISSCSCLTVLAAWVLLSKTNKPLFDSVQSFDVAATENPFRCGTIALFDLPPLISSHCVASDGEPIVSQRKPQILPRLNLAAAMVNGRSDQCRRARDPALAQRVGKGVRMVEICLKRGEKPLLHLLTPIGTNAILWII